MTLQNQILEKQHQQLASIFAAWGSKNINLFQSGKHLKKQSRLQI